MIAFPKKPRAKRRKIVHVCARCNTAFKSRKECWAHLETCYRTPTATDKVTP